MNKSKRIFDILMASLTLLIALPIMLLISIAIKLDTQGPILYSYRDKLKRFPVYRIGRNGRPFRYFKFRTMVTDLNETNHLRITRVGRFLRCWHLDELPELIIVLRGDMSLVGPRPHTKAVSQKFPTSFYRSMNFPPGITGSAQISGGRLFSLEQEINANLNYISNWCLVNDMLILIKTPLAIVAQCKKFDH